MQREKRGPRVKLGGSVLALLQLQNRRQIRTRLSQLSSNGGLLQLDKPLDEGIVVEVLFHVGATTVRSRAEMLFPMWATQGCLQPFEFADLEEADRSKLESMGETAQRLLRSGLSQQMLCGQFCDEVEGAFHVAKQENVSPAIDLR